VAEDSGHPDAILAAAHRFHSRYREHVAQALHDRVCQSITAAGIALDLAKMEMTPEAAEQISAAQRLLDQAFDELRTITHDAQSDPVARFGAQRAIERAVDAARRRFNGTLEVQITDVNGISPNARRHSWRSSSSLWTTQSAIPARSESG
jgi:signal transduction histidine kinase